MDNKFLVAHFYRMTSAWSASEANDYIGIQCQKINDLCFTFVTPLGSDNNSIWNKFFSEKENTKGQSKGLSLPLFR